eukprot:TRINITY_DN13041_c0_g1_i2.p1 TRINITY_DN13041_c0_g1~~TRINITY_DN13041_c0_g1_i2.p1  ORF type:complete len:368 (-),score=93.93 TRINITY_DN13041_c0_g1_i2:51-1154(-)
MESSGAKLLTPYKLGPFTLKNRCVMAALTRVRADPTTSVPNDLHVEYYSQRAGSAFILTECSQIVAESKSFPGSAGIHSEETVAGWKRVTDAVHEKGGLIFLQIWHGGRTVPSERSGAQPIGPSPIIPNISYTGQEGSKKFSDTPREMTIEDIKNITEAFRLGAERAKRAGFDGVQLHGANGYLIDNFLRSGSNKRTDEYGGSVENRCRFPLEVIDQLISVFGADRVGIKISPLGRFNDMYDENPVETFSYLLEQLDARGCSFVELRDAEEATGKAQVPDIYKALRPFFKRAIVANQGLDFEKGNAIIASGLADLVSFGRLFIANPDLVERFRLGKGLNPPDPKTFYGSGPKGYTDYPFLSAEAQSH